RRLRPPVRPQARAQVRRRRRQPRGTVLVTGGAEGLGRHASLWLAEAGAARLVVTTAGSAEDCADRLRADLGRLGTRLELCAREH
ncbi:KR domain-containing protein, partial [Streptomyces canarius]